MCTLDAKLPVSIPLSTGSRRRRIWDLAQKCHCPVVGVCLPQDTLRKLVNKSLGGKTPSDNYEVHVGAVAECGQRNLLSELLQHELEQRYARTVQNFRVAKTTEALALLWKKTVEQGDIGGALWAALTHPRCDESLEEIIHRNMHMLAHHASAMGCADNAEFNALQEANANLTREVNRLQERNTRFMAEKSSDIERLNAQLVQVRAEGIGKDSCIAFLDAEMTELKASVSDFESGSRLQRKVEQMTVRQTELEREIGNLRKKLATATKSLDAVNAESSPKEDTTGDEAPEIRTAPITLHLQQKTVLCVGGRSGNVASYRDLIERVGGRFAHHDGGLEDSHNVLGASLAAADLVICQTGCISHNAYWKVKDFCKRTGKRCVFVENPSTSSLARGLELISTKEHEAVLTENI